jgi:DNA-binding transcriptional ArsR family regulator
MKEPAPSGAEPLPAQAFPVKHSSAIEIERVFHALGDPTRRTMVEMLGQAPRTISALASALGITLTAVGQHLQLLEECGLARSEKLGRVRTCSLDLAGLDALAQWVTARKPPIVQSLDLLSELLAEEEQEQQESE